MVHAFGGLKDAYEGLWHAIPRRGCGYYAAVNQAHPCPMPHDNTFALMMKREYKIGTMYSVGLPLSGQSVSICMNIIFSICIMMISNKIQVIGLALCWISS